ncbi:MAG: flagellar biosynthesis protein FliQ [Gammaproteobacteria bacterium]|jgi:flagellar biosynthetic protein FliQ|nr:flagellar biosynthesis protein FliQ [Gammaproteobacteria bacterium]
MTPEFVVTLGRGALEVTLIMMAVLLLPALVVGVVIGVLQAATQINEMTLSFIPKLLITALVLVVGGPYLLQVITDYTTQLFGLIPSLVH